MRRRKIQVVLAIATLTFFPFKEKQKEESLKSTRIN
jgi:hypothetical protein